MSQCPPCPWRDVQAIAQEFPTVIEAAADGAQFMCHTRCIPCPGPALAGIAPKPVAA